MSNARLPSHPWYHRRSLKFLEAGIWCTIGGFLVKAIADHGQEVWFHNTILLFAMLGPGPIFGAALGCFFEKRRDFAAIGLIAQLPVLWWFAPAAA